MVGQHSGTKLKILRGDPGHHPILPEPEPRITAEVPPPPEYLDTYAKDEWLRLAPELHVIGLLTVADLHLFAIYCEAYGVWRMAMKKFADEGSILVVETERGGLMQNPALMANKVAARDMLAAAVQFGLTPAARRKLSAPGGPKAGKFNGLTQ